LALFGINVLRDRIYEPGTNTLVTSWKTTTGWVVVRDAFMGPRRGPDTVTPCPAAVRHDADHALVRTALCIGGTVEMDLVCEPAFDYGRVPGEWTLGEDEHRAEDRGQSDPVADRSATGIEAGRARSSRPSQRRNGLLRARMATRRYPDHRRRGRRTARGHDVVLARLACARGDPRPRVRPLIQRSALAIKGLTYADRRRDRRAHHLIAETPGGERN
jgi:hypothetical protein